MASESPAIVAKLWNYCDMLQDGGVSYGDYVQQLTNLLFLKMDDEQTRPPYNKTSAIPPKYNWQSILKKTGSDLETRYRHTGELGKGERTDWAHIQEVTKQDTGSCKSGTPHTSHKRGDLDGIGH